MRGKRAMEPYKDRNSFYTLGAISELSGYGGVLADDMIQIDLDDGNEAEILLKIVDDLKISCPVLQTTRGMHFYFRNTGQNNNRVGAFLAIGLKADIGVKNRLIPLKIEGVVRPWLRQPEQIDLLPQWLNPVKNVPDFSDMSEGDGRNQTLFNYILALQAAGFSKQDARFTLQLVNKFVLKTPLPKRELDTIMRDEAFAKPAFFNGSVFQQNVFGDFLINENHVCKINQRLHIFNGQTYTSDTTEIERAMIRVLPSLTQAKRKEVLQYLRLKAPLAYYAHCRYIAVKNGILDLETLSLMPFTSELIVPNQIPYDWNPNADYQLVDEVLDRISCHDVDLRSLLEEAPGYALFRRSEYGAAFFLTGFGKNGKSTYLDMIKNLIGRENYSALSFKSLDERFKTAELVGKLANIGDDIGKTFIEDNSVFKNIATGNTINVERKGEDPFDFEPFAKLFFSANDMPRIRDISDGLARRLWLIPFNASFSKDDPDFDPFIIDKLRSEKAMERFLVLAVNALKRVVAQKGLTEPTAVKLEKTKYEKRNNPIKLFLDDHSVLDRTSREMHQVYNVWCHENGYQALSIYEFSSEVCRQLGYETKRIRVDGKQFSFFREKCAS